LQTGAGFAGEPVKENYMAFKKAVKSKQRLRLAIDGISGSGKTYTALAIASGMGGKIALIDSEHGSASLYADRFDFDTLELMEFQIEDYVGALEEAAKAGYEIVIIDSTSHAWDALVERVERIAKQKFGGNTWAGWAEGTPFQKKLIEALLSYPGHVIVTCRSKSEYSVDKDDRGKTKITKVGTAAVQRQGFEYEFTMAMSMDANHVGFVSKDRTSKYQDKFIEKPGKSLGKELVAWLNEGAEPPAPPEPTLEEQYKNALSEIGRILNGKNESGGDVFSASEKTEANADWKKRVHAAQNDDFSTKLLIAYAFLDEKKIILRDRTAEKTEGVPGKPASAQEEPSVPSMYSEEEPEPAPGEADVPGEQNHATPPDDDADENGVRHFEDDIPDGDGKSGKKGAKPGKKGTPTAAACDELDIY